MDIAAMAKRALHHYPRQVIPLKKYSDRERLNGLYTDLLCSLSDLMEVSNKGSNPEKYQAYAKVLLAFFMISNEQKTSYKLLLSDEELQKMRAKWQSQSFNAVYLIAVRLLEKSHFEHQLSDFVRAWHVILKYGLVDLALDEQKIVAYYNELTA